MKSIKLFHKNVSQFSYSYNFNRFISQTIITSVNEMTDQNNSKEVIKEEIKCEDNSSDGQTVKRLKTEDNNTSSVVKL